MSVFANRIGAEPPAVAAKAPSLPPQAPQAGATGLTHPTAPAEAVGGRGNGYPKHHRFAGAVVPGLAPCKGFSLWSFAEQDGDGFWFDTYFARSQERDALLNVCRFNFEPTQERFDWLARNGFPADLTTPDGAGVPWDNAAIDARLADVRAAA